ncbi:hypothetical protein [Dinghuibacter silviterrae]|uniref:Uncharacterized protein n=1 Tax=Dinghuibacter silviterrae TaxID=1539049 RepID=A0A4R8DJM4_9BACT|nr:hypothetical protein [Dinghuibacter silviterrae]TDW97200.1 hypothetical protein EDB95_5045 [Dinghuibacter silviterrae]
MKKVYLTWLACAGILLLFDVFAVVGAPRLHIEEASLFWLTLLIYFAAAYEGARLRGFRLGVAFALLLSFFDGTVGLGVQSLLGEPIKYSFLEWVDTTLFYMGCASILGLGAGGLVVLTRPRKED